MASYTPPRINRALLAAIDLSASQFLYVSDNGSGAANIAGGINGAAGFGFLMNSPEAGQSCEIATIGGGAKGIAAETITVSAGSITELKADADGKMANAIPGDTVSALAMESAAASDVFEVMPVYYIKAAAPVAFDSAADLTGEQYYYVGDSSGDIDIVGGANGAIGYGFLMNAPDVGEQAIINGPGHPFAKAISHDAISINDKLISLATGKMDATTTTGDVVVAIALSASTGADEVIDVLPVLYFHP